MHGWTVSSWLDGIQMQLEREEVRINSYIGRSTLSVLHRNGTEGLRGQSDLIT